MNIKPIKTETDYNEALKLIDSLFDAKPNTPNGDKLDMLVTLVEEYEAEHEPIDPPDAVSALEYERQKLDDKYWGEMADEASKEESLSPDETMAFLKESTKRETEYLLSIPGMKESIVEGLNTDIDDCDEGIEWDEEFLK